MYSNDFVPFCQHFRLDLFLQSIHSLFLPQASQKHLSLSLFLDLIPSLGYYTEIYQDKQRLMQILANLVSNSIKYSQEGAVKIKARC